MKVSNTNNITIETIKEEQTNGKDSYFIVYERLPQYQNPPDTSMKLIPCPVDCEIPLVKEKVSCKNRLSNGTDLHIILIKNI